jgi:NADH-quinone oxidoreductase subunit M
VAHGIGSNWHLGIDGISLFLVLLTTALTAVAVLGSFEAITQKVRAFYMMLLALETGMLGTFVALDMVVFYIFWEAMLVPMYLLIGVWGGQERIRAAVKFFLYTMTGSVLMLVAILWLYFLNHTQTGVYTFDLLDLYRTNVPLGAQTWLFLAFALAFAIKVPMFPFHTWLPLAHVEAPTAGSVILAAVLLKMGTYGFMRFAMPLFPNATAAFAPVILTLAVIGIIYGALVAMVQPDLKKLVAYSSVSHLGFCMLGMFAVQRRGLVGLDHADAQPRHLDGRAVPPGRRHLRAPPHAPDLRVRRAVEGAAGVLGDLPRDHAVVDRPARDERLHRRVPGPPGAFRPWPTWTIFATTGVILSAVYMLWMFQRVIFGPVDNAATSRCGTSACARSWCSRRSDPRVLDRLLSEPGPEPHPASIEQSLTLIAHARDARPRVRRPPVDAEGRYRAVLPRDARDDAQAAAAPGRCAMNGLPYSSGDLFALLPVWILSIAAMVIMLVNVTRQRPSSSVSAILALIGIVAAAWGAWELRDESRALFHDMYRLDAFSTFFTFLFLTIAAVGSCSRGTTSSART